MSDVKTIGQVGVERNTWQADWPEEKQCEVCNETAYLIMAIMESGDKLICDNKPESVDLTAACTAPLRHARIWPHDAMAAAIYYCPNCWSTEADWNQA